MWISLNKYQMNIRHRTHVWRWCRGSARVEVGVGFRACAYQKEISSPALGVQKGASHRLSQTKIAFTCIPWGNAQNTGLSRPASQARSCMDTHTFLCLSCLTTIVILTRSMRSQTSNATWEHWTVLKITILGAYIWCDFVPVPTCICESACMCICACVCVNLSDCWSEIVWKLLSVDLPGGGKMMSKRQICIYRQTGILDLTAIQSLSACHVSPGATLPPTKAHGSHASGAALLAYLFPIQRPLPTKKTPEGQNKVSYLWMCQHGPSWNPARTLSNEPDNSTGAFSSQEKWYLQKPLAGWNQKLCYSKGDRGWRGALVNRRGIIQPQLGETPGTLSRKQWMSNAGWVLRRSGDGGWWLKWLHHLWLLRCMCARWEFDILGSWAHPGVGHVLLFLCLLLKVNGIIADN